MLINIGFQISLLPEHLLKNICVDAAGCWHWTGERNRNGYGRCRHEGKRRVAHRVIYEFFVNDIPDGHHLDHRCRMRGCVNPHHMEPVTPKVNTHRGKAVLFKKKEK